MVSLALALVALSAVASAQLGPCINMVEDPTARQGGRVWRGRDFEIQSGEGFIILPGGYLSQTIDVSGVIERMPLLVEMKTAMRIDKVEGRPFEHMMPRIVVTQIARDGSTTRVLSEKAFEADQPSRSDTIIGEVEFIFGVSEIQITIDGYTSPDVEEEVSRCGSLFVIDGAICDAYDDQQLSIQVVLLSSGCRVEPESGCGIPPCSGNGFCAVWSENLCSCNGDTSGQFCDQTSCPNNCLDRGTCENGRCICNFPFTGEDCSIASCPENCSGNGDCDDSDGTCTCDAGWGGSDCRTPLPVASLSSFEVVVDTPRPIAGQYFVVEVVVRAANGQVYFGFDVDVDVLLTDLDTNTAIAGGTEDRRKFSLRSENAGPYLLSVSVNNEALDGSPVALEVVPDRAHPSKTNLSVFPQTAPAGDIVFEVVLVDVYGNSISGFNLDEAPNLDVISAGASILAELEYPDAVRGVVTLTRAGVTTVSFVLDGEVIDNGVATVTVQPASPSAAQTTVAGEYQTVATGVSTTAVMTVRDEFGNAYSLNSAVSANLLRGPEVSPVQVANSPAPGVFPLIFTPPSAGEWTLVASVAGVQVVSDAVLVIGDASVTSVVPASGPISGSTLILVTGVNFSAGTACRFSASTVVPAVFISVSEVACTAPAVPVPGSVSFEISNNAIDWVAAGQFLYYEAATVTAIEPPSGPTEGNTDVTVTGTGFADLPTLTCMFGDARVPATFVSATEVTCVSPRGLPGAVPLTVALNGADPSQSSIRFAFTENFSELCRTTEELSLGRQERIQGGFDYHPNLALGAASVLSSPPVAGSPVPLSASQLADGDRCCAVDAFNQGFYCGIQFRPESGEVSSTVVLDRPAYINEVVSAWHEPCSNQPRPSYTVRAGGDANPGGPWEDVVERFLVTSAEGVRRPCYTIPGDASEVALCIDFFQPIVAQRVSLAFDNGAMGAVDGGWLFELEVHGVYTDTPMSLAPSPSSLQVQSAEIVDLATITVRTLDLVGNSLGATDATSVEMVATLVQVVDPDAVDPDADDDGPATVPAAFSSTSVVVCAVAAGECVFDELALERPVVGQYMIEIREASLDVAVSIPLEVAPGAPSTLLVEDTEREFNFVVQTTVVIPSLSLLVVDAGGNAAADNVGDYTVSVSADFDFRTVAGGAVVRSIELTPMEGRVEIPDLLVPAPSSGDRQIRVVLVNAGTALNELSIPVVFRTGSPYALSLEGALSGANLASDETVQLPALQIGITDPGANPVVDVAISDVTARLEFVSTTDQRRGDSVDAAALLGGTTVRRAGNGTLAFDDLFLDSPPAGLYELVFDTAGLVAAQWAFAITLGAPARLVVTSYVPSYPSEEEIEVGDIVVEVVDGGGNSLVGLDDATRAIAVSAVNGSLVLDGNVRATMNGGTVVLAGLRLLAPASGRSHELLINNAGLLQPATVVIEITIGAPHHLTPAGFEVLNIEATALELRVPTVEMVVVDAGESRVSVDSAAIGPVSVRRAEWSNDETTLSGTMEADLSDDGLAEFGNLKMLMPLVGTYELAFSAAGLGPFTLGVVVAPGPAAAISDISTIDDETDIDGNLVGELQVALTDIVGNRVNATGVSLSIVVTPNTAAVAFPSARTVDGVAVFSSFVLGGIRGETYVLEVTTGLGVDEDGYLVPAEITVSVVDCPVNQDPDATGRRCVCEPGFYKRGDDCELCDLGFFKEAAGDGLCFGCGLSKTTARQGATSADECVCQPNFYLDRTADEDEGDDDEQGDDGDALGEATGACKICPEGAICDGYGADLRAREGWWRATVNSTRFYECRGDNCKGGVNSTCAEGYKGPLCAVCDDGFGRLGLECAKCSGSTALTYFLMVVFVLLLFAGVAYVIHSATSGTGGRAYKLKILVSYLQVLVFLGSVSIAYPESYRQFLSITGVALLDLRVLAVECAVDLNVYAFFTITMMMPLLAILGLVAIFAGLYASGWQGRRGGLPPASEEEAAATRKRVVTNNLVTAILVVLFLVHPILTKTVFSMFDCITLEGQAYLYDDLGVKCGTSTHSFFVAMAVLAFGVFVVGIPASGFVILWRNRNRLDDPFVVHRLSFLYDGLEKSRTYPIFWEAVMSIRKVFLVSFVVFLRRNPLLQTYFATMLLVICMMIQQVAKPYRSKLGNSLELLALIAAYSTLQAGFFIDLANLSPGSPGSIILSIMMIAGNTFVIGTFVFFISKSYMARKLRLRRQGSLLSRWFRTLQGKGNEEASRGEVPLDDFEDTCPSPQELSPRDNHGTAVL